MSHPAAISVRTADFHAPFVWHSATFPGCAHHLPHASTRTRVCRVPASKCHPRQAPVVGREWCSAPPLTCAPQREPHAIVSVRLSLMFHHRCSLFSQTCTPCVLYFAAADCIAERERACIFQHFYVCVNISTVIKHALVAENSTALFLSLTTFVCAFLFEISLSLRSATVYLPCLFSGRSVLKAVLAATLSHSPHRASAFIYGNIEVSVSHWRAP